MGALWYFAYGSNMSRATLVTRRRLQPREACPARLDGYRLCFDIPVGGGERGVANLAPDPGACTHGVAYLLTPEECEHLDRTEGVHLGLYYRVPVELADGDGASLTAFTYRSSISAPGRKPSPRYIGLLLDGARAHGLPPEYIRALGELPLAIDERVAAPAAREEDTMAPRTVRFYFAYNSPYAFLANTRIATALETLSVGLEYRPVYSPRTGSEFDPASPRLKYLFEDVARFAEAYGLRLNPGPFADTKRACLGFLYAEAEGKGRAYHDGVFAARHLEERDIAQPDTLAEIAAAAGLERAPFLAALSDPRWEEGLAASNEAARGDEVFGFPFFVYAGKKFWGNDRIEWLVREIERGS